MSKKSDHVDDLDDPKYDGPLAPEPSDSLEEPAVEEAQSEGTTPSPPNDDDTPELPAPKAGDPDFDWSKHYPPGAELFRYVYPSGVVVEIHRFADIYNKQWLRSIRHLGTDFDVESAAIDRGACALAQEVIDSVPSPIGEPDQFQALWDAWSSADTDRGDGEALTTGE